ncbi:MAG: hypothetical protein H7Z42_02045, partial [Roseiflexaceae bacterium]|nr:hypothetical protein [Roseiflexaceae bacterium]
MFAQQLDAWVRAGRLTADEAAPVLRALQPAVPHPATIQPPIARRFSAGNPVTPAIPRAPSLAERAWAGLLALRTRQLLLFLGAFLLLVSSLVLVLLNWAQVPVELQCSLLVAVCGALWAGGEFLERRWQLASAGAGLRAVAGVLLPVVVFAILRALSSIDLHTNWLFSSLVCLPLYVVAARTTNQRLFSVAASLSAASATLAAAGFAGWQFAPGALLLLFTAYLPLARYLRRTVPQHATTPMWVAQLGAPLALLAAFSASEVGVLATTIWLGVLFYACTALITKRAVWSWPAAALGPIAAVLTVAAWRPLSVLGCALALVCLGIAYLFVARQSGLFARSGQSGGLHMGTAPWLIAQLLVPGSLLVSLIGWGGTLTALILTASVAFYALALWCEQRLLWSTLAAVTFPAALSAALAAFATMPPRGLEFVLLGVAALYLLVEYWLRRRGQATLAIGPGWTAQLGVIGLLVTLLVSGELSWQAAALAWGTVGFYLLALQLSRQLVWLWPIMALLPCAMWLTAGAAALPSVALLLALALLALVYSGAAVWMEPRTRPAAIPAYLIGLGLAALVGSAATISGTAMLLVMLPPLIALFGLLTAATHRGRLSWFEPTQVAQVAVASLGIGIVLLRVWLGALLQLTPLSLPWQAVTLLPLGAIAFAAARWWPGRLRRGYDLALQTLGALFALELCSRALGTRNPEVVSMWLLAATWLFQLGLRRNVLWSSLFLGTLPFALVLLLARLNAADWQGTLLALTLISVYLLGGESARRGAWRCLTVPGTVFGALIAVGLSMLVAVDLFTQGAAPWSDLLVPLVLLAVLALLAARWRLPALGVLASAALASAALLALNLELLRPWVATAHEYTLMLVALTIVLLVVGAVLRRLAPRHALPYELSGLALLAGAPVLALVGSDTGLVAWGALALAGVYTTWRYQMRWLLLPALLAS